MLQAILYGGISGSALVLGALVALHYKFKQKTVAAIMAFGAGVLICALTFGLVDSAYSHGGFDASIGGFLAGGVVFILGDYWLHIYGGRKHKRRQLFQSKKSSSGSVITLGAVLDGIPESIALGVALYNGSGAGTLMLVALFLSNFPESVSSVPGLFKEKFSRGRVLGLWLIVGAVTVLVTVASFLVLKDVDPNIIGWLEAFAGGAILAMLADSMIPEAFEEGGASIGILTVFGFLVAFVISRF
ncbi:MAG: ZIP family metal transporter [Patescibacteria group bacterium]|jgi:ZIP family zinc transporter